MESIPSRTAYTDMGFARRTEQMSINKCPTCQLVNGAGVQCCRRCGALIAPKETIAEKSPNLRQSFRNIAVPAIIVLSILCIYAILKPSKIASIPQTSVVTKNEPQINDSPTAAKPDEVKKLRRDFLLQLDLNMNDRNGEGSKKNQILASDTIKLLKQKRNELVEPTGQQSLDELNLLITKYYDQLVKYNIETAHIIETSLGIQKQLEDIQKDSSLSDKDRISRKHELKFELFNQSIARTVSSNDIEETVASIRNLQSSSAAQ
jgi:hypothetical protein